jgi:EF hand
LALQLVAAIAKSAIKKIALFVDGLRLRSNKGDVNMFSTLRPAIAMFCAGALTAVAATSAMHAHAASKSAVIGVVVEAPGVAHHTSHRHGDKHYRYLRYGVRYSPRFIVIAPGTEEFEEAYDDTDADEFDMVDRDNDGFISPREARRANAQWVRDFRRIDTNGDGFLTREEVDEFYADKATMPPTGLKPPAASGQ